LQLGPGCGEKGNQEQECAEECFLKKAHGLFMGCPRRCGSRGHRRSHIL
jgi:hypothetical protein